MVFSLDFQLSTPFISLKIQQRILCSKNVSKFTKESLEEFRTTLKIGIVTLMIVTVCIFKLDFINFRVFWMKIVIADSI